MARIFLDAEGKERPPTAEEAEFFPRYDAAVAAESAKPKMPTVAEILDGLLDGGQALATIKQRIAAAKAAR